MANISLLGSLSRIETPFIKVTIGNYTFGIYQRTGQTVKDTDGLFYETAKITYPIYLQSLTVQKINGQVNEYTLNLIYPIRPGDDPNFFEKVFSSVNKTRKITFSYGDISIPNYIYKDEQAIITDIKSNFNLKSGTISYTVSAVSSAKLGTSGCFTFTFDKNKKYKPSEEIKKILRNPIYGLKDLFYGMADDVSVDRLNLIPSTDKKVNLVSNQNISPLEEINYLVSCMTSDSTTFPPFYILTIHDEINSETNYDKTIEQLGGPYFKITPVYKKQEHSDAYEIDIGFPTANIIMSFNIENNENYSIYYDWQSKLTDNDYVLRLNDDGEWEKEYAVNWNSANDQHLTRDSDKTWWSKITQYPISATIQLKGLLRPATLMQYVKLNVLFFGKKHISSGTYIVTKQIDQIDSNGYRTTLGLTRVVGEDESEYDS